MSGHSGDGCAYLRYGSSCAASFSIGLRQYVPQDSAAPPRMASFGTLTLAFPHPPIVFV